MVTCVIKYLRNCRLSSPSIVLCLHCNLAFLLWFFFWLLLHISTFSSLLKQVASVQTFSAEVNSFFTGQSLQLITAPPRTFQRSQTARVVAYTKVASLPLELEAATEPPLNTYKNKQPYIGTIKSVERIVGPNATGETCHIIIDHNGDVPYWEGQSYGIIPPVSCQSLTFPWDTQVSAPSIQKRVSN